MESGLFFKIRAVTLVLITFLLLAFILSEKEKLREVEQLCNKGMACLANNQPRQAVAYFKKALEINADYYDACCNLGLAYEALGENKEAMAYFRKTLKMTADKGGTSKKVKKFALRFLDFVSGPFKNK